MRIHVIACRVFGRELSYRAALSPNIIDITWQPQGLHEDPKILHEYLEQSLEKLYGEIDRGITQRPDYIVLGYGLCSNGVVGITARDIPIVVPRTDDCIGVFLGSEERYLKLFNEKKGTYWLNAGWIESSFMHYEEREQAVYQGYVDQFGEDNADYLMEIYNGWKKDYKSCGYITGGVRDTEELRAVAKRFADDSGWSLDFYEGDGRLVQALVEGDFSECLVCPPGHTIEAVVGPEKMRAVKS